MKIAFFGDSLTVGIPGASYYDLLGRKLPDHELVNYARGGDSVIGAYRRIAKLTFDVPLDVAFLWIGINDVFVKVSWSFPIVRTLRRQPWTRSVDEFRGYYRAILDRLSRQAQWVNAVSPLFVGEDVNNPWNKEVERLSAVIEALSAEYEHVNYVNLRAVFESELASRQVSGYVPRRASGVLLDALLLKGREQINRKARERGLHFTLDGVHLNGWGAEIVADVFVELIDNPQVDFHHSKF